MSDLPLPRQELWGECHYCRHEWHVTREADKLVCPKCGGTLITWFFVDREEATMSDTVGLLPELRGLLNKHSMENDSNTPDFILAQYLIDCLVAYNRALRRRSKWYGQEADDESVD